MISLSTWCLAILPGAFLRGGLEHPRPIHIRVCGFSQADASKQSPFLLHLPALVHSWQGQQLAPLKQGEAA